MSTSNIVVLGPCNGCDRLVTKQQAAFKCHKCRKWRHRTCHTGKLDLKNAQSRIIMQEDDVVQCFFYRKNVFKNEKFIKKNIISTLFTIYTSGIVG